MKALYVINVQRADNGFVGVCQNDEPGVKVKKVVALSEADIISAVKDFADHMFDEPPPKPEPAVPTPAPRPSAPTSAQPA